MPNKLNSNASSWTTLITYRCIYSMLYLHPWDSRPMPHGGQMTLMMILARRLHRCRPFLALTDLFILTTLSRTGLSHTHTWTPSEPLQTSTAVDTCPTFLIYRSQLSGTPPVYPLSSRMDPFRRQDTHPTRYRQLASGGHSAPSLNSP